MFNISETIEELTRSNENLKRSNLNNKWRVLVVIFAFLFGALTGALMTKKPDETFRCSHKMIWKEIGPDKHWDYPYQIGTCSLCGFSQYKMIGWK